MKYTQRIIRKKYDCYINKKHDFITYLRLKLTFLIPAIFFMLPFTANATHIVGGEIGYRCLGGNQYEITLMVFRDFDDFEKAISTESPAA